MEELQKRTEGFLNRAVPAELAAQDGPGTRTEQVLADYTGDGTLDDEGKACLRLCIVEVCAAAERQKTDAAKRYSRDCADILHAIQADVAPGG